MSKTMDNKETIFDEGQPVDLPMMLDARETRAQIERDLLEELESQDQGSLLVMTMAVPGPIKANEHLNQAFAEILIEIKKVLSLTNVLEEVKREEETGFEYYALTSLSPSSLKPLLVDIEETHPLGRLFDLDVVFLNENAEIEGTSRTELGLPVRRCFICERPAKECGRSRRHSVPELQAEISTRILNYFEN